MRGKIRHLVPPSMPDVPIPQQSCGIQRTNPLLARVRDISELDRHWQETSQITTPDRVGDLVVVVDARLIGNRHIRRHHSRLTFQPDVE